MVADLTSAELALIERLHNVRMNSSVRDGSMEAYYHGTQTLARMGLAVPPELDSFGLVVNWPRVVVDTIENRMDVKSLILPGEEEADTTLRSMWDRSDMDSEMPLANRDQLVYGRGAITVATSSDMIDGVAPTLLRAESPRQTSFIIDPRTQKVTAAMRAWGFDDDRHIVDPIGITLFTESETVWCERQANTGRWLVIARDRHNLGQVPVFPLFNDRETGSWIGRSEMADVIPMTDAAARALTNLQVATEAMAVPKYWIFGAKPSDFSRASGEQRTRWESYMTVLNVSSNANAKIQQLSAADLSNFTKVVEHYGLMAAAVTGFPARYFGRATTNPPAEGAIRAEEAQLTKRIERKTSETGAALGRALALAYRIETGTQVDGGRVKVEWHDPGTPTDAQRADAVQKLAGGTPILSREGAWDMLGWSEARKDQERTRFAEQESDPTMTLLAEKAAGVGLTDG